MTQTTVILGLCLCLAVAVFIAYYWKMKYQDAKSEAKEYKKLYRKALMQVPPHRKPKFPKV